MNYLLFGGQPDSGKTSTLSRLCATLLAPPFSFTIANGTFPPARGADFTVLLERTVLGKKQFIIINSPSDNKPPINNLKAFIDKHSSKGIEIILSSVRDIDWERNYFFSTLKILPIDPNVFEIPLARVTRRSSSGLFPLALAWYEVTIDRHVNLVLTNPPFNL